MTLPVKWFHSSMAGAPVLSSSAGALIGVLDACLLTGFGLKPIQSLTRAGSTATASFGTAHGFQKYQVLVIAGADQSGYNGEFRVTGVTTNTLTFEVTGEPVSPATGTLTAKAAPVGSWEKAFAGTNKAAYRSTDPAATGLYLRVDDTNTASGWNANGEQTYVSGYETLADIDTGTGAFGGGWWKKSYSGTNEWALIGDGRLFHLFTRTNYSTDFYPGAVFGFGDLVSYRPGDAYHGLLQATTNYYFGSSFANLPAGEYKTLARAYHQGPGAVGYTCRGHAISNYLGYGGLAFPNPADNGLYLHDQILVLDNYGVRGELPGVKQLLHTTPVPHRVILDAIPGRPGALLLPLRCANGYQSSTNAEALFDLVGPWR